MATDYTFPDFVLINVGNPARLARDLTHDFLTGGGIGHTNERRVRHGIELPAGKIVDGGFHPAHKPRASIG